MYLNLLAQKGVKRLCNFNVQKTHDSLASSNSTDNKFGAIYPQGYPNSMSLDNAEYGAYLKKVLIEIMGVEMYENKFYGNLGTHSMRKFFCFISLFMVRASTNCQSA